jgi:hypothetical protein
MSETTATMTKGELRRARQEAKAAGRPLTGELALTPDQSHGVDIGPERLSNGRHNVKRARALERYARFVYDHDRD